MVFIWWTSIFQTLENEKVKNVWQQEQKMEIFTQMFTLTCQDFTAERSEQKEM